LGFSKTLLITLIVLCGFFLSIELSYRTWLYFRNCDEVCYNTAFFTKLDAFSPATNYEFLAADPTLGYAPVDGTFVIREPGWNSAKITIRRGVRVNPNFAPTSGGGPILVVGGSFVFGNQLSDDETWPAFLEQRLNRRVVNGGVSGYGPAQAVLRAEHLLKAQVYSLVILSILVVGDLPRDQYVNFLRFYRPAVIREHGKLRHTTVEESRRIVSEDFVCAHPWIPGLFFWSHIAKRFFLKLGYDGRCREITHPKAAAADESLEYVIERVAALPVNKAILIQYPRYSFEPTDEAGKIRDAANRHGIRFIDVYNTLKGIPLVEIIRNGNEVFANLIAPEIAPMAQ